MTQPERTISLEIPYYFLDGNCSWTEQVLNSPGRISVRSMEHSLKEQPI